MSAAMRPWLRLALAASVLVAALGPACAEAPEDDGLVTLTLPYDGKGWFRMRVFEGPLGSRTGAATSEPVFDTLCIAAQSRTFEVHKLPSGEGRSVLFEAYSGADCKPESLVAVGYRGAISVPEGGESLPHYHVPVFDEGGVTALPEDINLSASTAEKIPNNGTCEEEGPCETQAGQTGRCEKIINSAGDKFIFWCIPTCEADGDCAAIHPKGTCDTQTGWCMMRSPYPLNLSEPRGFTGAATAQSGDVVFGGGFGRSVGGVLQASSRNIERYDASTGLFQTVELADGEVPVGLAGFDHVGGELFLLAGGVSAAAVSWELDESEEPPSFFLEIGGLCENGCTPNMSDQVVAYDASTNKSAVVHLPAPVAGAAVVGLGDGRALVLGGLEPNGDDDDALPGNDAYLCTVEAGPAVSCDSAGSLASIRAFASASCVASDAGSCTTVLLVGGNGGGDAVELVDLSGDAPTFTALDDEGSVGIIWAPSTCGSQIVGGSAAEGEAGGLGWLDLDPDGAAGTVGVDFLGGEGSGSTLLFPAVARISEPTQDDPAGCWVAGGIDVHGQTTGVLHQVAGGSVVDSGLVLSRIRFGSAGAQVTTGALEGSILFGGGISLNGETSGTTLPVRGVEVLRP